MLLIPGCYADAILIPTPFYGVITEDIDLYSSVKLYCVPLDSKVIVLCPRVCTSVLLFVECVYGAFFFLFPPSAQPK